MDQKLTTYPIMIHIITPSVKLKFGHFDFKPANQDFLKEPDFFKQMN